MTDGIDAGASLQPAWRKERAAVLATVARRLGDLQKAEDAVQEAFVAAAVRWPAQGAPTARVSAWRRRRQPATPAQKRRPFMSMAYASRVLPRQVIGSGLPPTG